MSDKSSERKQQKDDPTKRIAALATVGKQRNLESRVVAVSPGRGGGSLQTQPSAIISAQPDLSPTFKANSKVLWSSGNIDICPRAYTHAHTGTHLHAHMCGGTRTHRVAIHIEETEEVRVWQFSPNCRLFMF